MAEETKKEITRQREVSLLLEARNLLKVTPSGARRDFLRQATDHLQECYDLIKITCTRSALRDLIGSATVVMVCIQQISTPPANPPLSGAGEVPKDESAIARRSAVA